MSLDHQTLVRRWFEEVWNQGSEATIDELFAADGIGHGLGEESFPVRGPEGFKPFVRNMRSAFPDVHIRIEDMIVQGEKVAVRLVLEGTHRGEGIGVAPTQRRVSVPGLVILRVADGQIAEGWNSWDQLGLLRQLGAIPETQGRDRFLSATK